MPEEDKTIFNNLDFLFERSRTEQGQRLCNYYVNMFRLCTEEEILILSVQYAIYARKK